METERYGTGGDARVQSWPLVNGYQVRWYFYSLPLSLEIGVGGARVAHVLTLPSTAYLSFASIGATASGSRIHYHRSPAALPV